MSLSERIEAKWIDSFVEVFRLCGVQPGDACAVLSETQSRASLVQLSELALARLGARWFHVVLPTPKQTAPVPVRSTGWAGASCGCCTTVSGGCTAALRALLKPVAMTVTRSWSPRLSS